MTAGSHLARYNADGSLDTAFGEGGWTVLPLWANAIATDLDSRIVVGGNAGGYAAAARYNPDGTLDVTFSGDGKVVADFYLWDGSKTFGVQSDGKIILAGHAIGTTSDFAVARYNTDGSLDMTFGGDGMVATDFGGPEEAYSVAIQADGRIVVVGFTNPGGNDDFAVARYSGDGTLDTTFGSDGKVTTHFGSTWEYASSVAIQADGKVVVAGLTYNDSTGADVVLARYLSTTSAQAQIDEIIANVQALVAARVLNGGQGKSFLVKLEHAIQRLDGGDVTTAIAALQAFINEVNALTSAGILTAAQAQRLIEQATAIIEQF